MKWGFEIGKQWKLIQGALISRISLWATGLSLLGTPGRQNRAHLRVVPPTRGGGWGTNGLTLIVVETAP